MDANGVVAAINEGHPIRVEFARKWGQFPKLHLSVDGRVIGQVACPNGALPKVFADEEVVHVRSGNGSRRGFAIQCTSEVEAQWLAQVLTIALRSGV